MCEIDERELKLKLQLKRQWFCDYCGEIIKTAKDGMLEWDSYLDEERGLTAENFRIVHGRWVKGCIKNRSDDNLADGHLHWYTGPDGLSELLSIQRRYSLDTERFNNIIRRFHVDFFEEAIQYLPLAREDGENEIDPYDVGELTQEEIKWLIRKYGNQSNNT
jgi:hypothetical protein